MKLFLIVLGFLLLDRFFRAAFTIFPDAIFLAVYSLSVFVPKTYTIIISFILGLYSDFVWCKIFGAYAFIYTLVSFMVVNSSKFFNFSTRFNYSIGVLIFTFFSWVVFILISLYRGLELELGIVLDVLLNFISSFAIYDILRWIFRD
ncbi:MAG: rod shape-determining protein MreD [bacterium]|nr:rod shape-determining protein MreD [bacterium]